MYSMYDISSISQESRGWFSVTQIKNMDDNIMQTTYVYFIKVNGVTQMFSSTTQYVNILRMYV